MTMTRLRVWLARIFAGLAVAAAGWTIVVWASGGLMFHLGVIRVSAVTWPRPLVTALVFAVAAGFANGLRNSRASLTHVRPATFAGALGAAVMVIGLSGNSWSASGADSFAYVSQAALWRHGQLDVPVPLAIHAPWPNAVGTFAPFGYRPAARGEPRIVPITAPGVPMLMALFQRIAGHAAAFLITPFAGAALVLLSYGIGRRLYSPGAGLIAAWLTATSPAVLYMLMWPMSDLPAAACTALMIWLLVRSSPASTFGAGLAAAAGVLTRPNFLLIAAAAGLWLMIDAARSDERGRWRHVAAFAAGLFPGALVLTLLNMRWFGSALASGYGTAGNLLSFSRVPANAALFARWLAETSPLAFVGIAVLMIRSRGTFYDFRKTFPGIFLLLRLVAIAAVSVYLLYDRHEEWWYLRFLLPAWPALFVPAAMVLDTLRARGRAPAVAIVIVVVAAGIGGVVIAQARGVLDVGAGERRYVSVARLVDRSTEPDAVILTSQHAGTVWYYAGRETLRFDVLEPAWLDRAVTWLAARGRHPYILVEDWEQPLFEARFKKSNAAGDLSAPPAVAWQSTHVAGWTWLYDPLDRTTPTIQPGPEIEIDQPRCAPPTRPWR